MLTRMRAGLFVVVCGLAFPACSGSDTSARPDAGAATDAGSSATVDAPMSSDAQPGALDAGALDATPGDVQFTNLRVEEVGAYRAVLRFTTSRPTTCEAAFGLAASALDRTATDPNMEPGTYLEQHEVPLEDLVPNTTYYVVGRAVDPNDNVYTSMVLQFTTLTGAAVDSMVNVAALARGSVVNAVSSNFGGGANDSTWGANKAFDDQMSTEWSSNGDGNGAFIEIDLGSTRSFAVVGFRSRKMSDGTSIIESFQLVLDGTTTLGPFASPDPDIRYLFQLGAPASARTVRLEAIATSGGNTGIKELQLFTPQ